MKRNVSIIGVLFILLVSACGPQATATPNPADVQQTAQAAAFTMVAATQQALPTNTVVPPTEIPSETPLPSVTPIPLLTQATQATLPAGAVVPTGLPTFTPQSPSGGTNSQATCNQPLVSWQGPTVNFSISNQTRPEGTIILSMYVQTDFNQCGYLNITSNSFSGPVGQYSAGAFITGKQNLKAFGSFRITEGNWSIIVRNDSILAKGGCASNC